MAVGKYLMCPVQAHKRETWEASKQLSLICHMMSVLEFYNQSTNLSSATVVLSDRAPILIESTIRACSSLLPCFDRIAMNCAAMASEF